MDSLLQHLVSIKSVCGDTAASKEIIDFSATFLRHHGMTVELFENHGFHSLYASPTGNKQPTMMLVAHLDVVAADDALFELKLEDGKYHGRGVFDMKYAAANYFHWVQKHSHELAKYDIGIMLTTDEEVYGPYGVGMLVDKGYIPKACFIPDAGENWEIEEFAKGRWFIELNAVGKSAHGSRPWEGDNAASRLIHALTEIEALFADGQQPATHTLNIGTISAGNVVNQVADHAKAQLDIRYMDPTTFPALRQTVEAICQKYGLTITFMADAGHPVINDLRNPYITAYTDTVRQIVGITPQPIRSYGTSDARFFSALDIPCVLSSPPGGHRHSNDEWLDEKGYQQFQIVIEEYLDKIARLPDLKADPRAAAISV